MLEAFNELMADPTSRAELVGGLVEVLIFIVSLYYRIPLFRFGKVRHTHIRIQFYLLFDYNFGRKFLFNILINR